MLKNSLFKILPKDVVDELSNSMIRQTFSRDQFVFRQGDEGRSLYVIESGEIKICSTSAEGKESILAILWPGDILGELAVLDSGPRSSDALTKTESVLLRLDHRRFWDILDTHPSTYKSLIEMLVQRLRRTDQLVEESAFLDVPARLASVLLRLSNGTKESTYAGIPGASVTASQSELAAMVGATREMVNKTLRSFEKSKMIERSSRQIVITSPESLKTRSGQ